MAIGDASGDDKGAFGGEVISRGKKRRKKQSNKEKPKNQTYGSTREENRRLSNRDKEQVSLGSRGVQSGIDEAYKEREDARYRTDLIDRSAADERAMYWDRTNQTLGQNEDERIKAIQREDRYDQGADQSVNDYRAGREATLGGAARLESNDWMNDYKAGRGSILGSAGELEGYARGAAAEYESAADAAAQAAAARTQRSALGVAAGRGANSIRTALAGANAANAQTALDQQVVRAQEANQLNAMRNAAIGQAAGIRTGLSAQDQAYAAQQAANQAAASQIRAGVGAADQSAAGLLAQRQQNAAILGQSGLDRRAGLEQANANYQLQGNAQQLAAEQANMNAGFQTAAAEIGAAGGQRDAFLGAEQSRNVSQLGADAATDAQRQEWAKNNSAHAKFNRGLGTATLGILGGE